MAEVYVTLGEAAELERVKYNTMVKRVLRKQESFVTKTEKSENGGKDVVLVAVSSLSKQARNAWKEREKLKSFTEEFPDKKEDEQKPEVPWYVNTDVDWYIENYKERYYKAGVSDAVFEGTKAANGWKSGRQVEEKEFKEACEAFRKAPVDGSKKDKEAKG